MPYVITNCFSSASHNSSHNPMQQCHWAPKMLQHWLLLMGIMPGDPGHLLGSVLECEGGPKKTSISLWPYCGFPPTSVSPCSSGLMEMELWWAGNSRHGPGTSQDWGLFGLPQPTWSLCSPHWELLAHNLKNSAISNAIISLKILMRTLMKVYLLELLHSTVSYRRAQTWSRRAVFISNISQPEKGHL